ncbi:MAG TPA: hybrid sensor histidine kinase/response regulator [Cyanobacteria bacterium UBA11162]|nr:hybrid sensor histidine kinase/response regulator [Cyanobacteria bacterium UBA11162]
MTIPSDSYQYFVQEAPELLQVLEQELLSLRQDYSINKVHNLMRTTHTLKGAAASVGLETIKSVSHSMEDIFKALFNPDVEIDAEVEALLFEGYECLRLALTTQLTGGQINDSEIRDRTAAVFAQLQEKLGDCFNQEASIPSSIELGFDVTQSIFEIGVTQRLEQIAAALDSEHPPTITNTLQTQAEVLLGVAQSMNLPGFAAIAQTAIAALEVNPEQVLTITQIALADFQAGQADVLNGDRVQGGQPSLDLQRLAGLIDEFNEEDQEIETEENIDPIFILSQEEQLGHWESESVFELESESSLLELEVNLDEFQADEFHVVELEQTDEYHVAELEQTDESHVAELEQTDESHVVELEQTDESHVAELEQSEQSHISELDQIDESSLSESQASELNLDESQEQEPDNFLLEAIWGNLPTSESPSVEQSGEVEQDEVEIKKEEETTRTPIFNLQPSVSQKESQKEIVSVSQTVRVNVEHLEHLNYSIGELLTNQNRQSLQGEQLQASVKALLTRLQHHQRQLDQLQDWYDRQFNWSMQRWNGEWGVGTKEWGVGNFPIFNFSSKISNPKSKIHNQFDPLELDRYSESQILIQSVIDDAVQLGEATEAIDLFTRQFNLTLEKQRQLLRTTRDTLMEARMLPLGEIFGRFSRVINQLETRHNKPVNLELRGTDVLVDKVIAQKLYDPLLHLVRNAFDHGIELSNVREQQGKPSQGQIEICAYHRGKNLVIEVRDDGQGLDFEQIRQRAVQCQLIDDKEANYLSSDQLIEFLFKPGFSTASEVNDLSGRGVGLDVVRSQLQTLQGAIAVDSKPQQGTTFRLQIPLSLTISKLLLIQAGEQTYALLSDAVEQILIPQSHQIRAWDEGKVLRWGKGSDEQLIPIFKLANALDYFCLNPKSLSLQSQHSLVSTPQTMPVILVRCQDKLVGLEVDNLMGEQELVIRPLGTMIAPPSYVYGGTILADGQLALVIDGAVLMQYISDQKTKGTSGLQVQNLTVEQLSTHESAYSLQPQTIQPQRQLPSQSYAALTAASDRDFSTTFHHIILVVDDSITVRQTLAFSLQKAGYQVIQSKDGYEAIEQLTRHSNIELVICDIEMPRMNGFEFLKYCQQDQILTKIPVIMLTSRSGEKHRLIASELGAVDYINKPYLEHTLLEKVQDVLEKTVVNS